MEDRKMSNTTKNVGIHLVLEGIDGSGKTTVANLLVDKFAQKGLEAVIIKAPDERFRDFLSRNSFSRRAKVMLYLADLIESWNLALQYLREGKVVIQDRSAMSTIVYQKLLHGQDDETCILMEMVSQAMNLTCADSKQENFMTAVVVLDLPAKVAMERASGHACDEYEAAGIEEWEERIKDYREFIDPAESFPGMVTCLIDTMSMSAEEVADAVCRMTIDECELYKSFRDSGRAPLDIAAADAALNGVSDYAHWEDD